MRRFVESPKRISPGKHTVSSEDADLRARRVRVTAKRTGGCRRHLPNAARGQSVRCQLKKPEIFFIFLVFRMVGFILFLREWSVLLLTQKKLKKPTAEENVRGTGRRVGPGEEGGGHGGHVEVGATQRGGCVHVRTPVIGLDLTWPRRGAGGPPPLGPRARNVSSLSVAAVGIECVPAQRGGPRGRGRVPPGPDPSSCCEGSPRRRLVVSWPRDGLAWAGHENTDHRLLYLFNLSLLSRIPLWPLS